MEIKDVEREEKKVKYYWELREEIRKVIEKWGKKWEKKIQS